MISLTEASLVSVSHVWIRHQIDHLGFLLWVLHLSLHLSIRPRFTIHVETWNVRVALLQKAFIAARHPIRLVGTSLARYA
ncbi:hypothetical protein VDGL01_11002 [Verticillium dahliae]